MLICSGFADFAPFDILPWCQLPISWGFKGRHLRRLIQDFFGERRKSTWQRPPSIPFHDRHDCRDSEPPWSSWAELAHVGLLLDLQLQERLVEERTQRKEKERGGRIGSHARNSIYLLLYFIVCGWSASSSQLWVYICYLLIATLLHLNWDSFEICVSCCNLTQSCSWVLQLISIAGLSQLHFCKARALAHPPPSGSLCHELACCAVFVGAPSSVSE